MIYVAEFVGSLPLANATWPTGILVWTDLGVVLVWMVLLMLIGSALGILREVSLGRRSALEEEGYRVELPFRHDDGVGHAA